MDKKCPHLFHFRISISLLRFCLIPFSSLPFVHSVFVPAPGSIPAGFSGFFIDIKSFRSHYGPGVDSASNRNEYQGYFLGVKAGGA